MSYTRITKATPKSVLQVLEDSYFLVGLIYIELFGGVRIAEAKEQNMTPAIPTDRQSILKRCENLEKEVRSFKLNLSFMNRK